MSTLSPFSMALVFEQIKRGKHLNLEDAFRMEYKLSQGFCSDTKTEFMEGVRALLIDKDKNPKWKHKSISEVS